MTPLPLVSPPLPLSVQNKFTTAFLHSGSNAKYSEDAATDCVIVLVAPRSCCTATINFEICACNSVSLAVDAAATDATDVAFSFAHVSGPTVPV